MMPAAETPKSRLDTMRAATVTQPGKIEIRHVPIPQPGPGEVRIRLEGCGVCASNIPPWEGREWFTYPMDPGGLGHEGWGTVDALGEDVRELKVGDRVAFLATHSYAEYDVADRDSVVRIPASLNQVPFPGEPLGCAINIFRRSHVKAGDIVAIVGIGFLGALLTSLCSQAGARVIAIARKDEALETAREVGAAETVRMDDHWKVIDQVRQLTGGKMCDVVIEAVGKQWPLDLAAELTKEMGRLVVAGYHQDGLRQVNMQLWNWRGLEVTNAHEREPSVYRRGMEEAIHAVESGRLNPSPLYSHRFALDELDVALNLTRDRPAGFKKALILMEPERR
ncbi:Threonine dehydrogenase-related Zn-dependent dehydrogenase [Fimbriimonas ginsengisoli Gsoil 348]|uniref:Threonine dehydrogenase-related Zn-dependent dehydrogenase n=2 Tax=Fimbriimonas ginsengisoli TaxID=1005039 RepID=A0A068NY68_FIMGI|nr:Threonine dehydrogenase-related Zn-dependent dehydrogenase [Fimbriimonas ginsengisoli Gsoil 348]